MPPNPQQANTSSQVAPSGVPQSHSASGAPPASSHPSGGNSSLSYASATRNTLPPNVSGSAIMSSAVGGAPPADSSSPVNGRNPTIPAVPSVGPTIVNGNTSDHGRKPSFTVTPSGSTGFSSNGGPVGGGQGKPIQFGSIGSADGSPAAPNPAVLAAQTPSALGVGSNPRATPPQSTPSPIPQPSVSGGRPPSGIPGPGNAMSFGNVLNDLNDPNVGALDHHSECLLTACPSAQCAQCPRVSMERAHILFTSVETLLSRRIARWEIKEFRQDREEEATRCRPVAAEDMDQGSMVVKWLTLLHRTSARPRTDEACPTCNLHFTPDRKAPTLVPRAWLQEAQQ